MAKRGRPATARDAEQALLSKWGDGSLKERGKRGMELASLRAVDRVSALIDSENPQIALAASREILARVYGMPKQSMELAVTDTTQAHLTALQAIQERARARLEAQTLEPLPDHTNEQLQRKPEISENTGVLPTSD